MNSQSTCTDKILFVRGGPGTGGFLEGGSDEQLADINNYATNGGNHGWGEFSDVLTAQGYMVEQIEETQFICGQCDNSVDFSSLNLTQYSLIVFGSNNAYYYNVASVDAVENYVRAGGAALFISDANFGADWWKAPFSDQFFLDRFGWEMNQDAGTYSINASEFVDPSHPILNNVSAFDGEGVSPITLTDNSIPGVTSTILARAKGQVRRNTGLQSPGPVQAANANDAALIIATVDQGRIAGHYDRNTFFNLNGAGTNINRLSNEQYAINLIGWLTGCTDTNVTPIDIPSTVQAEDYVMQSGIQNENTSDTGGGMNIGFVENGDFTKYLINVTQPGTYDLCFRVSSNTGGGMINVLFDDVLKTSIQVNNTGGWQSWQTINDSVILDAGVQTMTLEFTGGAGYLLNLNWIKFDYNTGMYFQLVDANANTVIRNLMDGDTIDLTSDGTDLNIIAVTSNPVGSIQFGYDTNPNFKIENAAPYALAGDSNGNYFSWTPTIGFHTVTATAFQNAAASGTPLGSIAAGFYVIENCATAGQTCDDSDSCTINDIYDASCNCVGTFNDTDLDGIANICDNCPTLPNANQTDTNLNGIGDLCETQCQPSHVLNGNYPSTSVLEFKAQSTIQSTSQHDSGADISYRAGSNIELQSGFVINSPSSFYAYIMTCTP